MHPIGEIQVVKIDSNLRIRLVPYCWAGSVLIFIMLECIVIFSQLQKHVLEPSSFRFFYLPIMLTLPFSSLAQLDRDKGGKTGIVSNDERSRLSFVVSFSLLIAYLTLLICLGELL
jgi:hypothetical protein